MKSSSRTSKVTRRQATQWADRALAAILEEAAAPTVTLDVACTRAWRQAAREWADAEQRRTGGKVIFS
jgi:hypothetical protein